MSLLTCHDRSRGDFPETGCYLYVHYYKQMEVLRAKVAKNVLIKESKCCEVDSVQLHSGRCTRRRVANDNVRCVK